MGNDEHAAEAAERKYSMHKIAAGDWLLPGNNDGKPLWRLTRYEDGPSHGLDPEVFPRDFVAWQVWRWPRKDPPPTLEDLQDWDQWDLVEQCLKTREEAIQSALRGGS